MKIALFGAKGRVGSCIARLAKGHEVWQMDVDFEENPLKKVDVAIDFSLPDATKRVCDFCKRFNCPLVTGVTGRNEDEQRQIEELSRLVTVVAKDNFCEGIALLGEICQYVASKGGWQCEIVERHRHNKKDAPSGTAKMLAGKIVKAQGSFCSVAVHSLRCGSNFGRHEVVFAKNGQSLTFTHQAEGVEIFAQGALEEAMRIAKNS